MISLPETGSHTLAPSSVPAKPAFTTGQKLESVFLAEMLKAAGVGKSPETFGGGAGEDQFASFLREAQAREMVRAGGLGLAAHFEQAIKGAGR
jgi:Rod binding domain-containing protein